MTRFIIILVTGTLDHNYIQAMTLMILYYDYDTLSLMPDTGHDTHAGGSGDFPACTARLPCSTCMPYDLNNYLLQWTLY